jgi:IrrE N-terminal-like domain
MTGAETRTNRYLSRICVASATADPHVAIARVVERYRKHGETLQEIAANLGVQRIVEEPLPFDGGIFHVPGDGTIIKLNSRANPSRRQFTLAHEVGHLVVASVVTARGTQSCRKSVALERTCNMIAAEVLMPAAEVSAVVSELKSSSPQNLRTLAHRFDVSLQAAAFRVRDLNLWKRYIGMWKWDSSTLSEVWFVGKCPWGTRAPTFAAFEAARDCRETVRGFDVTMRADYIQRISLELLNVGGGYILGLVGVVS